MTADRAAPQDDQPKFVVVLGTTEIASAVGSRLAARRWPWPRSWKLRRNKSLLVLFFRKEHLACLAQSLRVVSPMPPATDVHNAGWYKILILAMEAVVKLQWKQRLRKLSH